MVCPGAELLKTEGHYRLKTNGTAGLILQPGRPVLNQSSLLRRRDLIL